MQVTIKRWLSAALLACLASQSRADIAPMPHPGYTLSPPAETRPRMDRAARVETRVRMARERVDIRVGERPDKRYYTHLAEVTAVFEMVNDTPDTVSLEVGFPVEAEFVYPGEWAVAELVDGESKAPPDADQIVARESLKQLHERGYYRLRVSVDHGEPFEPEVVRDRGVLERGRHKPDYLWFHWDMDFPPGPKLVTVSYDIPSVYTKGSGYQNLSYVLHTGALWAGTIGSAVIAVHFPESAPPVHPAPKTTPGFERTDHAVTWSYRDFEPGPHDDIKIEFISPDAARAIHDLCAHLEEHPDDAEAMVELARLHMDNVTLAPDWPGSPEFAGQPGPLLERALEIDSGDYLGWNIYLGWYHAMRDGRLGFDFFRSDFGDPQRELLERAKAACPNDPGIEIWYDALMPERRTLPEVVEYDERLGARLLYVPERHGAGGTEYPLSHDDLATLETCYRALSERGAHGIQYELRDDCTEQQRSDVMAVLAARGHFKRDAAWRINSYMRELLESRPIAIKTNL